MTTAHWANLNGQERESQARGIAKAQRLAHADDPVAWSPILRCGHRKAEVSRIAIVMVSAVGITVIPSPRPHSVKACADQLEAGLRLIYGR